ncbi:MAG: formate dehydrogenase accessory sulfurtransferase FdhD, partial [Aeromicrobium sp.]
DSAFNVVTVETGGRAPTPTPRLGNTSSSCGICGSEQLTDLATRLAPLPATEPFELALLHSIPDRVVSDQRLFAATGASHAAAAFDRDGAVIVVREDVGRHNAVDKVVGWALREGRLPLTGTTLQVSGRASFELVQKAHMAGIPVLAAVSAPSSLAVEHAESAGMTLLGFSRGGAFNAYAGAHRITA